MRKSSNTVAYPGDETKWREADGLARNEWNTVPATIHKSDATHTFSVFSTYMTMALLQGLEWTLLLRHC
jgi:hypothetical protein